MKTRSVVVVWLAGLWLGLASSLSLRAQVQQPIDFDALLEAYSKMDGLEARFVEEKRLSLLRTPLKSQGRLYYARPGYLLRQIEAPEPSRVWITPTTLIFEEAGKRESIDLAGRRDLESFVSSFVALLSGDKAALTASYDVRFSASETDKKAWQVELTPKGTPLSELLSKVHVRGRGLAVVEVKVIDRTGDQTITRMLDVDPTRRFSESERQKLFGIDPS